MEKSIVSPALRRPYRTVVPTSRGAISWPETGNRWPGPQGPARSPDPRNGQQFSAAAAPRTGQIGKSTAPMAQGSVSEAGNSSGNLPRGHGAWMCLLSPGVWGAGSGSGSWVVNTQLCPMETLGRWGPCCIYPGAWQLARSGRGQSWRLAILEGRRRSMCPSWPLAPEGRRGCEGC